MKVKVTLPHGYGRSFLGKNDKGVLTFARSMPTFNFEAFDDEGNRLQEAYPSTAKMGPEMYRMLSQILPAIAARHNEGLTYEGKVEQKPRKAKELYAYYGFGDNPLSAYGPIENQGVGLIGFGETPSPKTSFGKDYAGHDNFLYSKKLDAPSPLGSNSRSKVLTNILNDSWDFNPLLGPEYEFTDTNYDPDNDPEGKGPIPTDHWVPRKDPVTGELMYKDDGRLKFMPVPLVQNLPIYNLKHPAYEEDENAAWDLVNDIDSAMNWQKWGKTPSYADYTGLTSKTEKGDQRVLDYLLYNSRLADKPGYFENWPGLKSNAHENLLNVKGQRSIEKLNDARNEVIAEMEKEQNEKRAQQFAKTHMSENGRKMSGGDMQKIYKSMFHHLSQDNPEMFTSRGLDPSEKNAIVKFAKSQGFDKYNRLPSDEAKMIVILDDYKKNKDSQLTQSNILSGVREPF